MNKRDRMYSKIFFFVIFGAIVLTPLSYASAKVGVGMGAGEIRVTEGLRPGGIYTLPSLRVFNTGDEVATYGMDIAYHQDYKELRPSEEWFSFSPQTFTLDPEESQNVDVTMVVPVKTLPGEYFAFVESGPVATNEPGTSVGIAVGTKLFFTVIPANIWQAMFYRTSDFFSSYAPWSWIGLAVVLVLVFALLFRKFFSFNIAVRKD